MKYKFNLKSSIFFSILNYVWKIKKNLTCVLRAKSNKEFL